ncbi:MAG: hypothetical protein Fur0016_21240 [Anaerolineales bacterium]
MSRLTAFFRVRPFLADYLSLAGVFVYAGVIWHFAHVQFSVVDEGLYLYKGWLLASGAYRPFQDDGLWMNQMPLSYLIPGGVQVFFGPGLATGRMFSFALGVLSILGWWLTARRLGGRWAALAVVWAMALNPAAARMSALAASQGLVAALLAWTMFFSLGSDRKGWQLFLGGLLAGVTVMVRINLLLLLPLLGLYVLLSKPALRWGGFFFLLVGMLISFGGTHALYWPNILRLWARWLPLPFLAEFFAPPNLPVWKPGTALGLKVASFFLAFRAHFAALVGSLAALVFWPERGKMKEEKAAIFLLLFFLSSFVLHAWAALGNEYCIFCFQTYTTFYAGIGLLLAAVTLPRWNWNLPLWRKLAGGLTLLALLGGMAYSAEGLVRDSLPENFYKRSLALPLPGFNGAQAWQVFANKFGLEYAQIADATQAYFPVVVAVTFGLVIFLAGRIIWGSRHGFSAGFVVFILLGTLFAPSPFIAGEYKAYDCPSDVLPSYEAAGAALMKVVPPGSKVYWAGYSPATLLYLPGIQILPGQLHGVYSFRISEDDAAIRRYGWWNQSLADGWLAQADFVLMEQRDLERESLTAEQLTGFELVLQTAPQSCRPGSAVLVYRRK